MAMCVKFYFIIGGAQELEVIVPDPPNFNFLSFMKTIKADGYFINSQAFIPYKSIQLAIYAEAARVQNISSLPIIRPGEPYPPKPETKQ